VADVRLTTPIATSAISARDHFKYVPSIDSITPSSGPITGATVVTITGSGFSTAPKGTTIKFATKRSVLVECSSSTTCVAKAPAHEAGAVEVTATVNAETSVVNPSGDSFTYG